MKYLLSILLLLSFTIYQSENLYSNTDTSYVLMPSIAESCKNIVFTDSMYRAWNAASVSNIKSSLIKEPNDALEWIMPQFIKGENSRLLFSKVLNDDSLITNEDFKTGFFIIEEIINGSTAHIWNYLILDEGSTFNGFFYKLFAREAIWELKDEKIINKHKFKRFFNKIKKNRKNEIMYPVNQFIVTRFTDEKIESFVFEYKGCNKCINQFHELTERYK